MATNPNDPPTMTVINTIGNYRTEFRLLIGLIGSLLLLVVVMLVYLSMRQTGNLPIRGGVIKMPDEITLQVAQKPPPQPTPPTPVKLPNCERVVQYCSHQLGGTYLAWDACSRQYVPGQDCSLR